MQQKKRRRRRRLKNRIAFKNKSYIHWSYPREETLNKSDVRTAGIIREIESYLDTVDYTGDCSRLTLGKIAYKLNRFNDFYVSVRSDDSVGDSEWSKAEYRGISDKRYILYEIEDMPEAFFNALVVPTLVDIASRFKIRYIQGESKDYMGSKNGKLCGMIFSDAFNSSYHIPKFIRKELLKYREIQLASFNGSQHFLRGNKDIHLNHHFRIDEDIIFTSQDHPTIRSYKK